MELVVVCPELVPCWDNCEAAVLDMELRRCWGVPLLLCCPRVGVPLTGECCKTGGHSGSPDVSDITSITAALMEATSSSSCAALSEITAMMTSWKSLGI